MSLRQRIANTVVRNLCLAGSATMGAWVAHLVVVWAVAHGYLTVSYT